MCLTMTNLLNMELQLANHVSWNDKITFFTCEWGNFVYKESV